MNKLETGQVLTNPHCIFDYSYFGQILFRVYFKGGYINEKDKVETIRKLCENQYIVSIYELSGEYELVIEIESPNPSRFNKEIKKVREFIPTLDNYKVILNVFTRIYPRTYLLPENSNLLSSSQEIIIGGDRAIEKFNQEEMNIMKNLLENPKIRFTALAKKSNLNSKTALKIYKNLQKRKVIKGLKYTLDTNKLSINKFILFLKLHNVSPERDLKLLEYLSQTKEIIQINKTVGDWDVEIDIESLDKAHIRYILTQIREEFKDLIENFNIMEFYQVHKKSYLPQYLFNTE